MHVGMAGEFRCVVTKADGKVKIDTGYQKNLILNQGLDFFGGKHGNYINERCAIGSGNSTPTVTQTQLDVFIQTTTSSGTTVNTSYVDTGDGLYRLWAQGKYRFTNLDDVNISEVGLVSSGSTSENYYLTTRALIKDSAGMPTSISVKTGETLDIYYKIHKIIDTADKSFVVNVQDGSGGAVPYNIVIRPAKVSSGDWGDITGILKPPTYGRFNYSKSDLGSIESTPTGGVEVEGAFGLEEYQVASYKRTALIFFPLDKANVGIRTLLPNSSVFFFYPLQIRFGRVSDDAPLTKTANDTLAIPLEFSWGRYEGEL